MTGATLASSSKIKDLIATIRPNISMVGTTGFEPVTSWSRTRRTTKLCYVPKLAQTARAIV